MSALFTVMSRAITDGELARRSARSFSELLAALGRAGASFHAASEIRRPNAVGARVPGIDNLWMDAVVVPADTAPPADEPSLPQCVWALCDSVPGRIPIHAHAMPVMGLDLSEGLPSAQGEGVPPGCARDVPPMNVVGVLNERAYGVPPGIFAALVGAVKDDRFRAYGLRADNGAFVCVALSLDLDDDVGVHYVATEAAYRRRGLATWLIRAMLKEARERGMCTATLQATTDGLPVYKRMGFRSVGALTPYVRPGSKAASEIE